MSDSVLLMLAPWFAVGVGLAAIGYKLLSCRGDRYPRVRPGEPAQPPDSAGGGPRDG